MSVIADSSFCEVSAKSSPGRVEKKRDMIQRLFKGIANRYDLFNRLASLGMDSGWRRQSVAIMDAKPGMRILDICTGTGDLAIKCQHLLKGEGLVSGLDFSAQMLSMAKQKELDVKTQMNWIRADCESIPIKSSTIDRATIGFALRNFTDLPLALSELHRVLKVGGKAVLLETGFPSNLIIRIFYFFFLFTIAPLIGFVLTGKLWPFVYFARSVKAFLKPYQCVELLNRCGFRASYIPLSFGLASIYIAEK